MQGKIQEMLASNRPLRVCASACAGRKHQRTNLSLPVGSCSYRQDLPFHRLSQLGVIVPKNHRHRRRPCRIPHIRRKVSTLVAHHPNTPLVLMIAAPAAAASPAAAGSTPVATLPCHTRCSRCLAAVVRRGNRARRGPEGRETESRGWGCKHQQQEHPRMLDWLLLDGCGVHFVHG